uniref:Cyanobacterial aminoacyl-tRNA synthetase CAAD domain-containing protein n=1 Tax=Araucaria cunninghamii TaxID=56994 RepID=A0A0D6R5M9_ARACU
MALCTAAAACYIPLQSSAIPNRPFLAPRGRFYGTPIRPSALKTGKIHTVVGPIRQPIRAATSEETSNDGLKPFDEVLDDLKEKWDSIENKSTIFLYGGGSLAALWVSSTVVSAINSVPLLPKVMELIGLGYASWFTYRFLLFKENRKELVADIEELKKKITGSED